MSDSRNQVIPAKSGTAIVVKKGETLRAIDLEGLQVCDFVCFNEHDHSEFFSAGKTRVNVFRVRISTGDRLYSNKNTPMFTLGEDTVGVHDLMFPPCNRWIYEQVLGQPGTTGCLENLRDALAPYGIEEGAVPDPFNIFMNTHIDDKNEMAIEAPKSKAGDYVDLIAEMDCLVGATSCAEEVASDCNGRHCTPIGLEIVA